MKPRTLKELTARQRVAQEVTLPLHRRRGRHVEPGQRGDEGEICRGIDGESQCDTAIVDDHAGRRRSDEARAVEDQGIDRDRGGQHGALDEVGDEREPRRLIHGIDRAQGQCQDEEQPDGDDAGIGEDGEQRRLRHGEDLREPDQPHAIGAVGQHAGDRAQDQRRHEIGHGHETEPGGGMGELPGEPAHRHAL